MKVICRQVRDKECDPMDTCSCGEPHEENSRCQLWCQCRDEWTRECVPVVPEYVRVTKDGEYQSGSFTYYYHCGNVHKVIGDEGSMWRVADIITDENDALYIDKAHCEPCEALYYGSHEHHVALNVEYQCKLKQGETKMKYKQLKPISLKLLWEAQPDNDCVDFQKGWIKFANYIFQEHGIDWLHIWNSNRVNRFFKEAGADEGCRIWLSYMEEHGFIEKDSEPITVTLRFKDEEDARGLLRDLDKSCRAYLYYQLLDQLQSQGVNL